MAKKSTTEWADILGPAREFEAAVTKTRSLYDLPLVADGAKEIALLSIFKEEQRFAFQPVMHALQRLSQLTDWSHSFFVCDRVVSEFFDWRKMPLRQYSSFQDFYHRELETTWGKWESLQHTYAQLVRGEISEADAEARVRQERAERAKKADDEDLANKAASKQGRRTDLVDSNLLYANKNDIQEVKAPTGTSKTAFLRRLRKDRPDIHARVLAGELSPNAGMIEAGFRNKRSSRKLTIVERMQRLWDSASAEQRAEFLDWANQLKNS